MEDKTEQVLWQNYLFITKEIKKFLEKKDLKLFNDLLEQRQKLQGTIENAVDNGYRFTPEGQMLLLEIQKENQGIMDNLQLKLSRSKHQQQVSKAYGVSTQTQTSQFIWKR